MSLSVEIDINAIATQLGRRVDQRMRDVLPQIADQEANFLLERWRAGASGAMYPGMSRPFYSNRYQHALARTQVQAANNGDVEVWVYNSGSTDFGAGRRAFDFVLLIENGRGPVDLKRALAGGSQHIKNRKKDGAPFIIVPFRHGSGESVHFQTNVNPSHFNFVPVSRRASSLARFGPAERGMVRDMSELVGPWHANLITRQARHVGPSVSLGVGPRYAKPEYTWKAAMHSGLQRSGATGHHQYTTFRTISSDSDPTAWILPVMQANPIFHSTVLASEPLIRQHVEAALRRL